MAKIKITKSAVDAAQPQAQPVELRDTLVPGFMCKITPAGRKVFMLQYRTNAGERRKPALGLYGDRMGRPLPSWTQCRALVEGEMFLLSATNPASFDSRYFGPIAASTVMGIAQPIYLEKQP